jgi:rubrerythrin
MEESQSGITEALKYAIQMEIDGKKFYSLSARESLSGVGKELFSWLAAQEDEHRKRFEQIYASTVAKKGWPVIDVKPDKHATFRTLFAQALSNTAADVTQQKGDLAAAEKAMDLEIKSRDFYKERSGKAQSDVERSFFAAVSAEEQGHYLSLIDFKEYMSDPVGFFTRTEHHSIDGQ